MAKARISKAAKGSAQPVVKPALVKVKIAIEPETLRLLKLEAFGRNCSLGQVVADLVAATPRRFVLTDRGVKGPVDSVVPAVDRAPKLSVASGGVVTLGADEAAA